MRRKGLIERNTFIRGLITEASPLTFPENASIVEENFELNRDGSRSRRLGLDYETGYTANEIISEADIIDGQINSFEWFDAGTTQNKNFIVVQVGSVIHFFDIEDSDILSDNKKEWTVDLTDYETHWSVQDEVDEAYTSFAVIRGMLIITNSRCNPVYVSYDSENDLLQAGIITVRTRDFTGIEDGFGNTHRPSTDRYGEWYTGLAATVPAVYNVDDAILPHIYNLYNQGWDARGIYMCHRVMFNDVADMTAVDGLPTNEWDGTAVNSDPAWPSNSEQMQVGKIAAIGTGATAEDVGKFYPYQLHKAPIRDTRAPRGSNIVNVLDAIRAIHFKPLTTAGTVEVPSNAVSLKQVSAEIAALTYVEAIDIIVGVTKGVASVPTYSAVQPTIGESYPILLKGVKANITYTEDSVVTTTGLGEQMLGFINCDIIPGIMTWDGTNESFGFTIHWDMDLFDNTNKTVTSVTFDVDQARIYYYSEEHIEVDRHRHYYGFSSTASFSGRAWYAGINSGDYQNFVFYSKTIDGHADLGKCYQEGDPTSEFNSDIIDTDGGYVVIPEAETIVNMIPMGRNLFVFATNGVWKISGGTDNFVATSHTVDKISSVGVESPQSIIPIEGSIAFWAAGGIYALAPSDLGDYGVKNISETTVQTDFLEISAVAKRYVKGAYDPTTKKATWLVNENPSYPSGGGVENLNKYDTLYTYETVIGSFFKHKIATDAINTLPWVSDIVQLPATTLVGRTQPLYSNGTPVQANVVDVVVGTITLPRDTLTQTKVLVVSANGAGTPFITFAEFNNTDFVDWYTHDGTGTDFTSRLVTGYELGGSLTKHKQALYLHMFFNRTETVFVDVGGNISADNPSSCLVYPLWDFATLPTDAQFTAGAFQAYRIPRLYIQEDATYAYGQDLITSKSKLRGGGRSLSLDIRSETGKDCHIYGWSIPITRQERT